MKRCIWTPRRRRRGLGGTAPRDQRNLGEAEGSLQNDQSAFNLWVAYQKSRDRPPRINSQELVEADAIIIDICRFASSRVIPINFDENLNVRRTATVSS